MTAPATQLLDPFLLSSHRIAAGIEREVIRRAFKRPPRLSGLGWADTYFYLSQEFSPGEPGPYSSSVAPYQREPLEMTSDPRVRRVVLMWGSQTGKTIILMVVIGRTIHIQPRPMLMVRPKIEEAENWSKKRLAPMLRDTEVLRGRVADARSRDSNNTLRIKNFPGGFLALASSQSPAELAADSISIVLADEVDRWEESAGGEGDPLELAENRQITVADSLSVIASSPGDEDGSRILPEYMQGDQREYYVPCPFCDHMQVLVFRPRDPKTNPKGGLRWEEGKPLTTKYECESCSALIEEKFKPRMLAKGEWRAAVPENPYPSYRISGLYSPFGGLTWVDIARKFMRAKGRPLQLKAFVTNILAEVWKETGERVESDALAQRLERYPVDVPDGVLVLTAAVDVQDKFLELWVWGWGAGEESWVIHSEIIPGDPNDIGPQSPWRKLDQLRGREFKGRDRLLRIARGFVDIGGHYTGRVYNWTRLRNKEGWFACQGRDGEFPFLVGQVSFQQKAKTFLYPIGTHKAKDAFLRSQLFVREPGPGYVHLPDWISVEQLEGLTSEKRVTRIIRGHVTQVEWVKVRERNEPLDCRVYAYAALHSLGVGELYKLGIITPEDVPPPPDAAGAARRRRRVISRGIDQ